MEFYHYFFFSKNEYIILIQLPGEEQLISVFMGIEPTSIRALNGTEI